MGERVAQVTGILRPDSRNLRKLCSSQDSEAITPSEAKACQFHCLCGTAKSLPRPSSDLCRRLPRGSSGITEAPQTNAPNILDMRRSEKDL